MVSNVRNEEKRVHGLIEDYKAAQNKRDEELQKQMFESNNIMSIVLSIFSPLSFISGIYGTLLG